MSWKQSIIVGNSIGPGGRVDTATSFLGWSTSSKRPMYSYQRSAQAAAGYVEVNWGAFPGFHDLIDPTTPKRNRGFEVRGDILSTIAAGACSGAWGIHDLITAYDFTTLVGVGFQWGSDSIIKTFLRDAPGNALPVRLIHEVVTAQLANVVHDLAIVFDGWTKKIIWLIDEVEVASYTPSVQLDQIGGSASVLMQSLRFRGVVPANGNMTIAITLSTDNPQLLLREFP